MKTVTVSRKTHNATFSRCKNLGQLIATIEKEGERDRMARHQSIGRGS